MGRKKWSGAEKFQIALTALKGETTIEEICRRYKVAASQVHECGKNNYYRAAQRFLVKRKKVIRRYLIRRKK